MDHSNELQTAEIVKNKIHEIRGQKVMLDSDLAILYGVETKRLNEQVRRNPNRFPIEFMFQLTEKEWEPLRSQFATSNKRGGRKYMPHVFTEHGILMLSNIINSPEAIVVSIKIIKVFTQMRQLLLEHIDLKNEIITIKEKLSNQDKNIELVFTYLDELIEKKAMPRKRIGFMSDDL